MNKIRGQNENDINLKKGKGKIKWIEEKVRIEISNFLACPLYIFYIDLVFKN